MSRKESAGLFFVIAMLMFTGPHLVPYVSQWQSALSHRNYHWLLAFLYFMPGIGVIFLVLAVYRAATKGG